MIGFHRTWLLWRVHRLRTKATRLARIASEKAQAWRKRAAELERRADELARLNRSTVHGDRQ